MESKLIAGNWYRCTEDIFEQYFKAGGTYKCNLDGYLMNDARNNVKVTKDNCFEHIDVTKQDFNHVSYYEENRKISPFDIVEDWGLDFYLGNVIKYIGRLWRKPDVELSPNEKTLQDINKAIVYLTKERDHVAALVEKERNNGQLKLNL